MTGYNTSDYQDDLYEQKRREQRSRRIAEMKRKKRQQELRRRLMLRLSPVVLVLVITIVIVTKVISAHRPSDDTVADDTATTLVAESHVEDTADVSTDATISDEDTSQEEVDAVTVPAVDHTIYSAATAASTDNFFEADSVNSTYGIVVDLSNDTILAQQNAYTRINPASMTKVLTVLVAAEHISNLDDTFTMTQEINNYIYSNDCSAVNWENDETITIRDLFYGTILPSGADAALGLAYYVAGSQEAFVDLMNEKLDELGLSSTAHFTNCIGLYDENHYCTMYDMAMIMEAAVHNEWCREVLSAHKYTTSSTPQHPDGIEISNWFLRRIEDKDTHGEVVCAKTGFVVQSGNCAVSYGTDTKGNGYIIVTGNAHSSWRCIYDHVALYQKYLSQ